MKIPKHIAIIMDGNGRWAKAKGLARTEGHREGARSVEVITKYANELGVKYLTLYAFSTENWARPKTEILALMTLLEETLDKFLNNPDKDIKVIFSSSRKKLPKKVLTKMEQVEKESAKNKGLILNLAINYGSRQEILEAVLKLQEKGLKPTKANFEKCLYNNLPDPDLIIRTSGEQRLSNFLLWQAAYSEFYFTKTLWPDFREKAFLDAIKDFSARQRRFGA
ncbi:MAG: di-trans,poly-cis-decaprenylcistransferase [Elusimicrobiaceae bacterium]|nr:di-trans,poly-cis-decaprenylcistransferase [Elusimicrobiaceae bacterium]